MAEHVAARLVSERLRHPSRPLGLATGRTMEPVFRALAAALTRLSPERRQAVRRGWSSFNLDEYVGLGAEDPPSFTATMRRQLVEPLQLDPAGVRVPDGLAPDPEAEARRYASSIAEAGGIGLQLLGLGLNGHVAFNEPPCGPDSRCRCLRLSQATRRQNADGFGGDPTAVPECALTLGLAEILAADRLLLVVTGAAKAGVLRRTFAEPPTPELPASWLQGHRAVTVVADAAALALP